MRRSALLLGAAAGASLLASALAGPHLAARAVAMAAALRAAGLLGWLAFAGAAALACLAGLVPGALIGMAAGAIFGLIGGFAASASGILAGALGAFALSRSRLRPWVQHRLAARGALARLDQGFAQQGWRLVALLRVSPIMPFSLTSYALGLSGLGTRDYALGTLAALPALLGYVAIGALGGGQASRMGGPAPWLHLALLGLGIAATLALTLMLGRLLHRVLATASVS